MKNIYSFILGHSPELSLAELRSVLDSLNIDFEIVYSNDQFLILETNSELDVESLNNTLGGIIKIGKLEFFVDKLGNQENLVSSFVEIIKRNCNLDKKVKFGFSLYIENQNLEKFIFKLSMGIKKYFKSEKISSRVVTSKEKELSSVIVDKEHLINLGFDMQILKIKDRYYFMRTLAVQDFERFNALDYDRPRVDSKSGMMPPKLAKMMLNLTQNRGILLDPFCGSGTVLLMAAELGFKKIIGSDILEKAVQDSQENMQWYQERFNKKVDNYIFKSDIKNLLIEGLEEESVDCVVSEGYLGKPLHGNESLSFIQKQIKELRELYLDSLQIFQKLLKNKGCVIISLPIFVVKNKEKDLDILQDIKNLGLKIEPFLKDKETLVYKRKNQKVYRQIIKLVKR